MTKDLLKKRVCEDIAARGDEIIALAEAIWKEPEMGFKETKTAAKVAEAFGRHQIRFSAGLAVTGIKARLTGGESRQTVAVLGELDAATCYEHPQADRVTGAVHACGHHGQLAAMFGCGISLLQSGVMKELGGDVVLFAVPAEEYVEMEFRSRLRAEGKIAYLGGKAELIRLGAFDDVDMAMMIHHEIEGTGRRVIKVGGTSNGFIGKMARYLGRESHAAGAPHLGINALNAAILGIMGIHAQRETFRSEDCVRVSPMITKGGDLVSIVPSEVRLESQVRAKSLDAMLDANRKFNRAIKAGAAAIGAQVEITDVPGYLPLINEPIMTALFEANASAILGSELVEPFGHMANSTDLGDLAQIMPVIHPWVGGVQGAIHTRDFRIVDPHMAYIVPAQCMAMTVIDLLADRAERAKDVLKSYSPKLTKEGYIQFMESIQNGSLQ